MTRSLWSWLILVACAIAAATLARADTPQENVLSCFSEMGVSTEWNDCLNRMFAPCTGQDVGSDGHIACLTQERNDWRAAKFEAETGVLERLTEDGLTELSGLMLAWPKFVEDKCNAVGAARAQISSEAANLGCQISELALLTNEMTACLDGRSTEDYCQLRPE